MILVKSETEMDAMVNVFLRYSSSRNKPSPKLKKRIAVEIIVGKIRFIDDASCSEVLGRP